MRTKIIIAVAVTLGVIGLAKIIISTNTEVNLRRLDIKTKQSEINHLENKIEEYDNNSEQSEQELQQLKDENDKLQQELQAKLDRQAEDAKNIAYAAELEKEKPKPAPVKQVQVSGDKESWLRASGIPESEWWAVDSIVSRESGWNPSAVNKSSGACGLGQQLPCGKWAGAWNDPVAALKAQYGYVVARYGGYPQAVAFWNINHWY